MDPLTISDTTFLVKQGGAQVSGSVSLDSAADRASLMLDIECDLSPENLTCGGEMPRAMVIKRAKYLNACMKELRALK